MFDSFRKSLEELINGATPPEERRALVSRMRDTLVQARASLHELRDSLAKTRRQLEAEERELVTVRRRKELAQGIRDHETVAIAARYEETHEKRAGIVRQKVAAQEAEVALAEGEVESMSAELKAAVDRSGVSDGMPAGAGAHAPQGAGPTSIDPGIDPDAADSALRGELDALRRASERSRREADAERRLEELKRRMGRGT